MLPVYITILPLVTGKKLAKGQHMKTETKPTNNTSGLPEVAQDNKMKLPKIIIFSVILIGIICAYFYGAKNKKSNSISDETYSIPVQTEFQVNNNKEQITPMQQNIPQTTVFISEPQVKQEDIQQQAILIQEKQKELQQRLSAPLMLVKPQEIKSASDLKDSTRDSSTEENSQFMSKISAQANETANATVVGPLNQIIAQGSLIHAVLESAAQSDLPGSLRAMINTPVYSEDGTQILVPRGSRLMGQYKNGVLQGQTRLFIVWTRLITPRGISINLGSPGVDSLGVAGLSADEIDRHFWERFGTASLLSLIGAGAANIGVDDLSQQNSASMYRSSVASSFAQSANQSLQQDNRIAPTLKTYQGKPILVFVARDLNFQNALKQVKHPVNIF